MSLTKRYCFVICVLGLVYKCHKFYLSEVCYILTHFCGTFHYSNSTTTLTAPSINTTRACFILTAPPPPTSFHHLTITKLPPQELFFYSDITTLSFLQPYITTPPPRVPHHFCNEASNITSSIHFNQHQCK